MKRALAFAAVLALAVPATAWADEDEEAADEASSDDEGGDDEGGDEGGGGDDEEEEEEEETDEDGLPEKQNLTGRDEGSDKRPTEFEAQRFFVDKVDTEKTENKTLVQGSLASSSFFYGERGGQYGMDMNTNNAGPSRVFTELRLQTDFRHIAGSRWEARIDARARLVNNPTDVSMTSTEDSRIQSGFIGTNEYDVRELWLVRSGKRSDVFIGRQFLPDLGGFKFDGLRVDYAKSAKLTLIGFAGLLPIRGSRSVTTDYLELKTEPNSMNVQTPAGKFVATGGFGGAYRTVQSYGSIGGAVQAPLKGGETPRVYLTTNGYLRNGAKLDFFHYILVDILGRAAEESASSIQLTNLSAGVNFKPNPRLRLTAAFHRVDTETLGVQAGAFLAQPDAAGTPSLVQNEAYVQRIASNMARGGVSAGLGPQQRFEVSTAVSYRFRPTFTLASPDRTTMATLPAASSVEVWGSFVDRRSIKKARIGLEVSRSFQVGQVAYQRSIALIGRLFVLREIANGRGEWEAEVSYSDIRNTVIGDAACSMSGMNIYADCYGASNNTLVSGGGQVFYRLKQDWFGIATLHLLRITNRQATMGGVDDPVVYGATGFVRIAKRF